MKKIFLIALLAMFSSFASAQNYKNDSKPYAFFCQIEAVHGVSDFIRPKITWFDQSNPHELRDEKGEKIEFLSDVDAINYMTKRGWEYVEVIPTGGAVYYMFRKYVTTDAEAKEGLYFKEDFK